MTACDVSLRWVGRGILLAGLFGASTPPAEAAWRVTLTILQYQQIDAPDDRLGGEFYPKVEIAGHRFRSPDHREDTMRDAPNWRFTRGVDTDNPVPIRIGMWDHDWPDADDHLDVSPVDGHRSLQISFDPRTGRISGDVFGFAGQAIPAVGRGESDRVRIVFRVTSEWVSAPSGTGESYGGRTPVSLNWCDARSQGTYRSNGSQDSWQGGSYPECARPLLHLNGVDFRNATPGGSITIGSLNFDNRRGDQVIGLVRSLNGRMYVWNLLQVAQWTPNRIVVQVHQGVEPGEYGVVILNRLPESDGTVLGVFEQGSNVFGVTIH